MTNPYDHDLPPQTETVTAPEIPFVTPAPDAGRAHRGRKARKGECPLCECPSVKVIYYGLPVRLCENHECHCLWGFFSGFLSWLPFNGYMLQYEGSYWQALWAWLTDGWADDDDF